MGKLIVIEGTDSSGKETQSRLLEKRLEKSGQRVKRISFPSYDKDYSAPVKMYLSGELGSSPDDVNPYACSVLYAVDRLCSFKSDWEEFYEGGGIVVCDRYTTSNAVHQGGKLDEAARFDYLEWLFELEYKKMGLPAPDLVLLLDMPFEAARELRCERANKITGGAKKDIHESDDAYMKRCYEAAKMTGEKLGWIRIECACGGGIKAPEAIADEIEREVAKFL